MYFNGGNLHLIQQMPRRYFIFISFKGQRYSSAGYITSSHSEGEKCLKYLSCLFLFLSEKQSQEPP